MAPPRLGIFALVTSLILLTYLYASMNLLKFYGKIVWFCWYLLAFAFIMFLQIITCCLLYTSDAADE